MKTTSLILLLFVLALIGCGPGDRRRERESKTYVAYGTVRNVWCHGTCDVTFEHDSGEVQKLEFYDSPPLWAGERVRLEYSVSEGWCASGCVHLNSTQRLPERWTK